MRELVLLRTVAVFLIAMAQAGCGDEAPESPRPTADLDRSALEGRLARAEDNIAALERRLVALERPSSTTAIEVALPGQTSRRARIEVSVHASQIFVDDEAVAEVALRAHLEALLAKHPDASVIVQAGPRVDHQRVVETMETIKEAGFGRIAMAARVED